MTTTSLGLHLRPILNVGKYAFVDEGSVTTLYDTETQQPIFYLSSVGEYALARMLIEKTQHVSHEVRAKGEALYRDEVSVEGRLQNLS